MSLLFGFHARSDADDHSGVDPEAFCQQGDNSLVGPTLLKTETSH